MGLQVIMRPCYNRPEMLKLSLDYEIAARNYYDIGQNVLTIFIVEYGSPEDTLKVIDDYPFYKKIVHRHKRFGLSVNILEGFKYSFSIADDWVIYIEDDVLVHNTYFKYIDTIMNIKELADWTVISAFNFNDDGDVSKVRKDRHYAALAPVISKYFFDTYVEPCATNYFYEKPAEFVLKLNHMYKKYTKDRLYRYTDSQHHQQAGLINRLCDVARIEEGKYVVMPEVNRQMHIGFFGYNRPGGELKGKTFNDRLEYLKSVITSPESMYNASGSKQYDDYKVFSKKLDTWDGTLTLSTNNFIS